MTANGRVLVGDRDTGFVQGLRERLARAGFEQRSCTSSDQLVLMASERVFEVVVVDLALPPSGGLEACRQLRANGHCGTVISSSSLEGPLEEIMAYESGADGFFHKQHDLILLEAQIRRAVRAHQACAHCAARHDPERNADIHELAPEQGALLPIDFRQLTRMEERLLAMLHRSRGELVPTRSLVNGLWGRPEHEPKNLYDLVSVLREKLERAGWTIVNQRKRGYRLERRSGLQQES